MMESKKRFLPAVLWLVVIAFLLLIAILSYYYLHKKYASGAFFWTEGNRLLAEVIWWSVFGALTNAMISAISVVSEKTSISGRYLILQLLQIVGAPLIALSLFALLYYPEAHEGFDKSFIILSYTAGLLSGYLLLSFNDVSASEHLAVASHYEPAKQFYTAGHATHEPTVVTSELVYGLLAMATVNIVPELDDAGLFFDEKKEVLRKGFGYASVSLQSIDGGEIIVAEKTWYRNQVQYQADHVEQGAYLLRAMLSVRMADNSLLNLFGEEKISVTDEEINVIVRLRKLEV